jgi:hypothetical protein
MKKLLIFTGFSLFLLSEVFVHAASAQTFSNTETNNADQETTEVLQASNTMIGLNNLLLQLIDLNQIDNPLLNETISEDSIADNPQTNIDLVTEQSADAIATQD